MEEQIVALRVEIDAMSRNAAPGKAATEPDTIDPRAFNQSLGEAHLFSNLTDTVGGITRRLVRIEGVVGQAIPVSGWWCVPGDLCGRSPFECDYFRWLTSMAEGKEKAACARRATAWCPDDSFKCVDARQTGLQETK